MSERETHAAFITAALVLLVMPIVFVLGLASAMLILQVTPWREASGPMIAFAVIWGLLVLTGVLIVARRIHSRSARA